MDITNSYDEKSGTFIATEDGVEVGRLTFKWTPDYLVDVDHTESKVENKGIGRALVEAVVKFARENDLKIDPSCSYARSVMEKTESMHDVLKK